jgi:tetratricopeptide (TPR) repeat protein
VSPTDELATAMQAATAKCAKGEAQGLVRALAGALVPGGEPLDETTAEGLLLGLNERRWFDLTVELGQALAARGPMSSGMQRRYAQALIERGQLAAARTQLEPLARQKGIPASVRAEARGLIGRAHKQEFIDQLRASSKASAPKLKQAITAYLNEYEEDPPARDWHGVNAVALLVLAQRRGLTAAQIADPKTLAEQIVKNLQVKRERTRFDDATLAEAFVALGRYDEAAASLQRYVWHPDTSAFSLGSTLRQLEEVWELDAPGHPGQPLLTVLRARLIEVEQGAVTLQPGQVHAVLQAAAAPEGLHLEKVFGKDHFVTFENYRKGLERCQCVARIGRELSRGDGTGFLIRGSDLSAKLSADPVLITNCHVINPTGSGEGFRPDEVVISFHALDGVAPDQRFTVKQVLWSSPPSELDATIVTLDGPVSLTAPYPLAKSLPLRGARVTVLGHPGGGTLSFSIADNELLDYEDAGSKLHYRTPTEGGSSGSPVFNQDWRLIGLHHAGGDAMARLNGQAGTYQANEGIRFEKIREAFEGQYQGG